MKHIKITIDEKHLYVYENNIRIHYFEIFESQENGRTTIAMWQKGEKGEAFVKENHGKIIENVSVYWFDMEVKVSNVMFVDSYKVVGYDYLVLLRAYIEPMKAYIEPMKDKQGLLYSPSIFAR